MIFHVSDKSQTYTEFTHFCDDIYCPVSKPQDNFIGFDRLLAKQQKFRELHAQQLRQAEYDLDRVTKQKLADFDAILTEQKTALKKRHAEQRTGLAGFLDAVKLWLNSTLAAEQAAERRKEAQQLARRDAKERAD